MKVFLSILRNRNTLLVASIVFALLWGDIAQHFKHLTFYILALVLSFSTSGLSTSGLTSKRKIFSAMGLGILLNYLVFGTVLLTAAYFLSPSKEIFYGFVIIAATPPGVAIIPFSYLLGGDITKSTLGTLGGFLASIILAPFIIMVFTGNKNLDVLSLFLSMVYIIVIPLIISRFLLIKPLKEITIKIRGKIVNWGFALIMFIAVGINREVFLTDYDILFRVGLIFFIAMFVLGQSYDFILSKCNVSSQDRMSQNLMLTLKSSGFAVVTALSLFNERVAIPSALLSVFVLSYILFLTYRNHRASQKEVK